MSGRQRLVLDTNTLISAAILEGSISHQALLKAVQLFEPIVSTVTWAEFESRICKPKLRRYFKHNLAQRDAVIESFAKLMTYVPAVTAVDDCRDADDNAFLALALDGGATLIVTGDQDLLSLHPWRGISILNGGDFCRLNAPA
jgi:uncharacterized protein